MSESSLCNSDSPIALLKEITLGPLYALDSKSNPDQEDVENRNSTISKI